MVAGGRARRSNQWPLDGVIDRPPAAVLFMTGRAERLTQTMQLAWPVMLLPGATFAFIGVMQSLGYGQDGRRARRQRSGGEGGVFAAGLLLHSSPRSPCWMTEARAADHPGGECAWKCPSAEGPAGT